MPGKTSVASVSGRNTRFQENTLVGARIGIKNLPGKRNKFAVIDVDEGDDPVVIVGS